MAREVPALPIDVEALVPELAGWVREVTLLFPRSGEPGVGESSLGGPLLWPAEEAWPMCAEPGHYKPLREPVWYVDVDPEVAEGIGHGTCMGDMGGVYLFVCRECPGMPFAYRYDCS
jgi:hypothetical protein